MQRKSKPISFIKTADIIKCCVPVTDNEQVQRHLAVYHGVIPLLIEFFPDAEATFDAAISELVRRGYLDKDRLVAIVQSGRRPIWRSASTHIIQVQWLHHAASCLHA